MKVKIFFYLICSFVVACEANTYQEVNTTEISSIYKYIESENLSGVRRELKGSENIGRLKKLGYVDPLIYSSRSGACAVAKLLLEEIYTDVSQTVKNRALLESSAFGHSCMVIILLKFGAEVNYSESGANSLYYSLESGHVDTAEILIENGIDVLGLTDEGENMAFAAALSGDVGTARYLIERGVSPTKRNLEGKAPLDYSNLKWGGESAMSRYLKQFQE